MPRFFVPPLPSGEENIVITGDDARHIALSLRMAVGDTITVSDGEGMAYTCVLTEIRPERVTAAITSADRDMTEPPCRVRIYMAWSKSDKLETVVQKATELGADEIIPFMSSRCVLRPDASSAGKKLTRYRRIAEEAAKQCGRGVIPTVKRHLAFDVMLKDAAEADVPLFFYEGSGTRSLYDVISDRLVGAKTVSIVTGSEGGFSESEAAAAKDAGLIPCGLGRRILRCETAPLYALSCVMYESELKNVK